MAQETLKITITADNKQAVQNIQETVAATSQLGATFDKIIPSSNKAGKNIEQVAIATDNLGLALDKVIPANNKVVENMQQTVAATTKMGAAFQKVAPASNQATQALVNVSRVAQDAPYGFIGIANNLNPLLESFQRLKETSGSAGGALKEMAKGLMGPAGIGLALGVVSSLIVAFGPKIASFINGTTEASKAQDKLKESLDKAQASATENGIKLLAYISVAENANNTDARRKEALSAVVNELGKVNAAYASTIKTTNDAKNAVKLYTEALVAQAITSRYIDEIADKTIALADANKKILQTGREYYKTLEMTKNMSNGYADASIVQARSTAIAKDANIEARKAAINLKNGIVDLNTQLTNTITLALNNPFYVMDKGAQTLNNTVTKVVKNFQALKSIVKAPVGEIIALEKKPSPLAPAAPQGLLGKGPSQAIIEADEINKAASELAKFNYLLNEAETTSRFIAQGVGNIFQAMAQGENLGDAVLNVFKDMTLQLAQMVIQALIFKGIMSALGMGGATGSTSDLTGGLLGGLGKLLGFTPLAEGGIVSKPTFAMVGEGGESEAVMPLSKLDRILGNAFTSGANSGGGMSGGSFVLKGNDLVLALQRSNSSLNLRRGGI